MSGSVCGCGVYVQEWKWGVKLVKKFSPVHKNIKKIPFFIDSQIRDTFLD